MMKPKMKWYQVYAIGGLGAVTPMILDALTMDPNTALSQLDWAVVFGHVFRFVGYFIISGCYVVFQKKLWSAEPSHIFQMGMVAPMALTALANANAAQPVPSVTDPVEGMWDRIGVTATAHAGETASQQITVVQAQVATPRPTTGQITATIVQFPQEPMLSKFLRGVTKKKVVHEWWVLGGSYSTAVSAQAHIRMAIKKVPYATPEVVVDELGFVVIYGRGLARSAANKLAERLKLDAVCESIELRAFPKLGVK